jgi:hypothetical protein
MGIMSYILAFGVWCWVYFLGLCGMLGYYNNDLNEWVNDEQTRNKWPPRLTVCLWWPLTLPVILAFGIGRYIHIRVYNWYDQQGGTI